jgi:hypothetical protein
MEGHMGKILLSSEEKFLEFFPARFGKIYKSAQSCPRPLS